MKKYGAASLVQEDVYPYIIMAYIFLCNDIAYFQFIPKSLLLPKSGGKKPTTHKSLTLHHFPEISDHDLTTGMKKPCRAAAQVKEVKWLWELKLNFQGRRIEY